MKYILFLILLIGCTSKIKTPLEPKFHYGDTVKVTNSFYGTCEGIIVSHTIYDKYITYDIQADLIVAPNRIKSIICSTGAKFLSITSHEKYLTFIKSGETK